MPKKLSLPLDDCDDLTLEIDLGFETFIELREELKSPMQRFLKRKGILTRDEEVISGTNNYPSRYKLFLVNEPPPDLDASIEGFLVAKKIKFIKEDVSAGTTEFRYTLTNVLMRR